MSKARDLADLAAVTTRLDEVGNTDGALSNRRINLNGAMRVAQRGTSYQFSNTNATNYGTVDRWAGRSSQGTTLTQSVQSDAPAGFTKSLRYYCDSGGTITQMIRHQQQIEGQDWQHLAYGTADAKDVTLSFWVKSNVTATFTVSLYVYDANEIYTVPYTIDSAGTWEYKTITFTGNTSGNCNNDNTSGIELAFALGAASGYSSSGVNNAWQSYNASKYATGITGNIGATTGNYWQITGVQLEVGDTATPFEHRSYGDELARCQRYYEVLAEGQTSSNGAGNLLGNITQYNSTLAIGVVPFKVTKRALPTGVVAGGNAFRVYSGGGNQTSSNVNVDGDTSLTKARIDITVNGTAGYATWVRGQGSSCLIAVDAEL